MITNDINSFLPAHNRDDDIFLGKLGNDQTVLFVRRFYVFNAQHKQAGSTVNISWYDFMKLKNF